MVETGRRFESVIAEIRRINEEIKAEKERKRPVKPEAKEKKAIPRKEEPLTPKQAEIVEKNAGLVLGALSQTARCKVPLHYLTGRYLNDPEKKKELFQIGSLGLIEAVKKHDPEKAKLSTYAYYHIRQKVLSFLRKEDAGLKRLTGDSELGLKRLTGDSELDAIASEEEIFPEKLWRNVSDPEKIWENRGVSSRLEKMFNFLSAAKTHSRGKPTIERNFALYVLIHGLGHEYTPVAKHYKVGSGKVKQITDRVHKKLPEELRLDVREKETPASHKTLK